MAHRLRKALHDEIDSSSLDARPLTDDKLTQLHDSSAAAQNAANEAQVRDEHRVNPLWMITVALAILFGFGALSMFA